MRKEIAGISIDLGASVFIIAIDERRPVFHRNRRKGDLKGCGVRSRSFSGLHRGMVALPPRHAVRFARPCRRCWPELARDPQLELELLEGRL